MIGGGSVVGLLLLGLLAWFLFGGSAEEPSVVAESTPASPRGVVQPAPPGSTSQPADKPEAQNSVADATPANSEPTAPAREPQPLALTRIDLDKRLLGYELPGATWAAAYDEATGRLAMTNDEEGVVIYDLDDLLSGKLAPVATLPTDGLPTAVCLKVLADRRVFVLAGQDAPKLQLVDADTLEQFGEIALEDLKFVDFLAGSSNPDDPFVYYSTHQYRGVITADSDREDNKTADRLGRVDLVSRKQNDHTAQRFIDVALSPDGERLYARPNSTANGVTGAWSELLGYSGDAIRSRITSWPRNSMASPVQSLGEVVAVNTSVYDRSMRVLTVRLDYAPGAAFKDRPLLVGLSKGEIVFGSANDYRRVASIPLPGHWLRTDRMADAADFRLRHAVSPSVRSGFLDISADSTRATAVITFGEHLVLAPLGKLELRAEPSLFVGTPLPGTVAPGEQVELDLKLKTEAAGVTFEFVPNTDWLPNEKQRLLGTLPPGTASPKALTLGAGVTAEQTFIILRSLKPLAGRKPPMTLRIGNEVMRITKIDRGKLIVERSNPMAHGGSERIAVIDERGRDLTTPTTAPKPAGKQLVLAAAVNNQQSIIFLGDVEPLSGEKLPLDIQIGDERMTVTAVDDFKTALTVKRAKGVFHSVTSDVVVLAGDTKAEAGPNLPTVSDDTFQWTPTSEQLGRHTLRMRATAGGVTHEWFWHVDVARSTAELPFQVVGIEPEPGGNRAVIWGQTVLPFLRRARESKTQPNAYFVGIYDLAEKRLLRHLGVEKPITSAALDKTGVYACLSAFDVEPKADLQAERARERALRQITPTQIVRLDVETLKVVDQVEVPKHCKKLRVIAGRYLAAFDRWRNETFRFNIPKLSPVEPAVRGYEYAIAGRVRDGWVWDGVVWDEAMKKPRLLLFPVHFERPPGAHAKSEMIAAAGGTIHMHPYGAYVSTWCPQNQQLAGQISATAHPVGLSCTEGALHAYSWAAPSQPRVGSVPKPTSVKLLDLRTVEITGSRQTRGLQAGGYVAEADGHVQVALVGKLYSVALDRLIEQEEVFRFVEEQDRFVLPAGRPAKLSYSAPGAVKYHFQLWYQRPHFPDEEPAFVMESSDGTFELPLGDMDRLAGSALRVAGVRASDRTPKARLDRIEEHVTKLTPAYRQLTGKKPRGVPCAIYVSVIAEHEDGQQKAGLAHSYLVEVPMDAVKKAANRR